MGYVHNSFFRHYRLYMYTFMTHCDLNFNLDSPGACTAPLQHARPMAFRLRDDVDLRKQPEVARPVKPAEAEPVERTESVSDDRSTLIKQKVDEGVKDLIESFE